jgi:hypothetical protein
MNRFRGVYQTGRGRFVFGSAEWSSPSGTGIGVPCTRALGDRNIHMDLTPSLS